MSLKNFPNFIVQHHKNRLDRPKPLNHSFLNRWTTNVLFSFIYFLYTFLLRQEKDIWVLRPRCDSDSIHHRKITTKHNKWPVSFKLLFFLQQGVLKLFTNNSLFFPANLNCFQTNTSCFRSLKKITESFKWNDGMQSLNKMRENSKCQNSTLNSLVEVAKDLDPDLKTRSPEQDQITVSFSVLYQVAVSGTSVKTLRSHNDIFLVSVCFPRSRSRPQRIHEPRRWLHFSSGRSLASTGDNDSGAVDPGSHIFSSISWPFVRLRVLWWGELKLNANRQPRHRRFDWCRGACQTQNMRGLCACSCMCVLGLEGSAQEEIGLLTFMRNDQHVSGRAAVCHLSNSARLSLLSRVIFFASFLTSLFIFLLFSTECFFMNPFFSFLFVFFYSVPLFPPFWVHSSFWWQPGTCVSKQLFLYNAAKCPAFFFLLNEVIT